MCADSSTCQYSSAKDTLIVSIVRLRYIPSKNLGYYLGKIHLQTETEKKSSKLDFVFKLLILARHTLTRCFNSLRFWNPQEGTDTKKTLTCPFLDWIGIVKVLHTGDQYSAQTTSALYSTHCCKMFRCKWDGGPPFGHDVGVKLRTKGDGL